MPALKNILNMQQQSMLVQWGHFCSIWFSGWSCCACEQHRHIKSRQYQTLMHTVSKKRTVKHVTF